MATRSARVAVLLGAGALIVALGAWLLVSEPGADDANDTARHADVLTREQASSASGVAAPAAPLAAHTQPESLAPAPVGGSPEELAAAAAATAAAAAPPGAEALFSGRVVDESGAPVAGAEVWHVPSPKLRKPMGLWSDGFQSNLLFEKLAHATTDGEGRFSLRARDLPREPDDASMLADARGQSFVAGSDAPELLVRGAGLAVLAHVCRTFRSGSYDAGDIKLPPGAALVGRTLDDAQRPVDGANVHVDSQAWSEGEQSGDWRLVRQLLSADTDAAGRFRIDGFWPGEVSLEITHPDVVPFATQATGVAGEDVDLGDLVLVRGDAISGLVLTAEGEPIAGASILGRSSSLSLVPDGGDTVLMELRSRIWSTGHHEARTTTGADGRFRLGTLNQSHYHVYAETKGCEPARLRSVKAGSSDIEFRMSKQATLLLTVVDAADGTPVPGVHATAHRCSGNEEAAKEGFDPSIDVLAGAEAATAAVEAVAGGAAALAPPDPAGLLLVTCAGNLRNEVVVSAPGYATRGFVLRGVVPPEQFATKLKLHREAVLAGRVLDADGAPIPRVALTLSSPADARVKLVERTATSDAAGAFRFGELMNGEWELVGVARGFLPGEPRPLFVKAEQAREDVELVLQRGAALAVLLLRPDGTPADGADVSARRDDPSPKGKTWQRHADEEGHALFEALPAGPVIVQASPGAQMTATLVTGTTTEITLQLQRRPVVHGRVTSRGQPVAGASVSAIALGENGKPTYFFDEPSELRTSATGDYELELYEPHTFVVFAFDAHGTGPARSAPVTIAPGWNQRVLADLAFGGAHLSGVVLDDATQQPVAGARIMLHGVPTKGDKGSELLASRSLQAMSDAEGHFAFERLQPGNVALGIIAKGYATANNGPLAVVDGQPMNDVRVLLAPATYLKGTVRTANGAPLPSDLRVGIEPVGGPKMNFSETVHDDGTWSFGPDPKPGAYALRVYHPESAIFGGNAEKVLATVDATVIAHESRVVDMVIDA